MVLDFLRSEFHDKGIMDVSMNEVFAAQAAGNLPGPPTGIYSRRGHANNNLFRVGFYKDTGKTVLSIEPAHKRSALIVWRCIPELCDMPRVAGLTDLEEDASSFL